MGIRKKSQYAPIFSQCDIIGPDGSCLMLQGLLIRRFGHRLNFSVYFQDLVKLSACQLAFIAFKETISFLSNDSCACISFCMQLCSSFRSGFFNLHVHVMFRFELSLRLCDILFCNDCVVFVSFLITMFLSFFKKIKSLFFLLVNYSYICWFV